MSVYFDAQEDIRYQDCDEAKLSFPKMLTDDEGRPLGIFNKDKGIWQRRRGVKMSGNTKAELMSLLDKLNEQGTSLAIKEEAEGRDSSAKSAKSQDVEANSDNTSERESSDVSSIWSDDVNGMLLSRLFDEKKTS